MTDSRNLELFVSLGHNSSACVAVDGVIVAGYEQERMDRRKSSSAFPSDAIRRCLHVTKAHGFDTVYVSHWFDDWTLRTNKYLDWNYLYSLVPNRYEIVTHHPQLTHHDAHARSAQAFARSHGENGSAVVVVMDGFGNRQECFSVYRTSYGVHQPVLSERIHGYRFSLGLMYQYATEFVGLKMHADEYKLLGYESHILEHFPRDHVERLAKRVSAEAQDFVTMAFTESIDPDSVTDARRSAKVDTLINQQQLSEAREYWRSVCAGWVELFGAESAGLGVQRIVVAFCAQRFLESATQALLAETVLKMPGASNDLLILTGGSFFNVKLNRMAQRYTGMRTMAHPWAGDAGAAMGMATSPMCVADPFIGHRDVDRDTPTSFVYARDRWVDHAARLLLEGRIVNVVRGAMEYGPRALCNTTTFALPTKENVSRINALNERDEAMPMAPVMTREAAVALLSANDLEGVAVSDRYMITTCQFANGRPPDRLMGVAHKDPLYDVWTARPQVTHDPEVVQLLRRFPDECLINTSYNYHGEPIVNTWREAVSTHSMQCFRSKFCGMKDAPVLMLVSP